MCLSWRDLIRNYPRPLCESPVVLKEIIPLAYLGLLFTANCCKRAIALRTPRPTKSWFRSFAGVIAFRRM
jgi:hypothetical protein